ncbi:MAG: hypothetical protein AB9903_32575 [Vulcanimicrobiota bacterium]
MIRKGIAESVEKKDREYWKRFYRIVEFDKGDRSWDDEKNQ